MSEIDLWTWQSPGFAIDRDKVKPELSPYLQDYAEERPRYERVWAHLGTDQVVWCMTCNKDWAQGVDERVRWSLRAPLNDIACFVDDWLGHRIIDHQPCPDLRTWRSWRRDAVLQHPGRPDRRAKFIAAKLECYSGTILSAEEAWAGYILDEPESAENISAIIRCPVDPSWIVERPQADGV